MRRKIFFVAAVLLTVSRVHAQDSVKTLSDVLLDVTKYPVKQNQTGKVITIIDHATIEKSSGKSLSELLNEQAGVTVSGALNNLGTNQSTYLQGAGDGRTLILIDG